MRIHQSLLLEAQVTNPKLFEKSEDLCQSKSPATDVFDIVGKSSPPPITLQGTNTFPLHQYYRGIPNPSYQGSRRETIMVNTPFSDGYLGGEFEEEGVVSLVVDPT
jgi:hypothetical protein